MEAGQSNGCDLVEVVECGSQLLFRLVLLWLVMDETQANGHPRTKPSGQ